MARTKHASRHIDSLLETFAAEPERWRFGYELSKELGIGSGTLYPALVRLADDGLLEQRWEHADGARPRHVYRLTCDGVAFAASRRQRVRRPVLRQPQAGAA